jgi:hypothetical protein
MLTEEVLAIILTILAVVAGIAFFIVGWLIVLIIEEDLKNEE